MKPILCLTVLVSLGCLAPAAEPTLPSLPDPVTNNAVASLKSRGQLLMFSLMGMGSKKTWDAVTNAAYLAEPDAEKWSPIHPVPGTAGRIAAAAAGARDHVFLFGGYVMDPQRRGRAVPDVNVYEPLTEHWARGEDLPVAVADSVIGVYRDRYIYLVGGRSNSGIAANVQVYDGEKNKWLQATPLAGTPVFGHAGTLLDDTIVYVGGAYQNPSPGAPAYLASEECWKGKIDHHDPGKITWTKLAPHPGGARFRIAAAAGKAGKIYFAGGTDNPYDTAGIGYDGKPSEPSPTVFAFDLREGKWEVVAEDTPHPTMDHRGLIVIHGGLVVIGGMEKGQQVTARVALLPDRPRTK
jgi:N-acetylneuraminic acid mutarotase